ncbi:MAG: DUF2087 domain-containing protein [Paracoccaceae bacterium]|nr:DUF2087 domain-containing protein [Paracoccaceae bacterium]
MPKTPLPLRADDLTPFARRLSQQLGKASPSHLTLMNMLARAAGYENVQHMRAAHAAAQRLDRTADERLADPRTVERALHQFDAAGRLRQWPSKRTVQTLALWALWATLPSERSLHEREVSAMLCAEHLFQDPATLRRTMISCGLLTRRPDGSDYRRHEQEPPAEAKALIRALGPRRRTRFEAVAMERTGA